MAEGNRAGIVDGIYYTAGAVPSCPAPGSEAEVAEAMRLIRPRDGASVKGLIRRARRYIRSIDNAGGLRDGTTVEVIVGGWTHLSCFV